MPALVSYPPAEVHFGLNHVPKMDIFPRIVNDCKLFCTRIVMESYLHCEKDSCVYMSFDI